MCRWATDDVWKEVGPRAWKQDQELTLRDHTGVSLATVWVWGR